MAHSTMLHVRVDDEIKTQASEALAAMGLSVSDAVRILLKRVVDDQAFPLELKVPNAQTRAAMEEARAMAKARAARFDSADALIDDLENASFGASQKPASSKRAAPPRACDYIKTFLKPKNGSWMHLPALLLGRQARRDDAAGPCLQGGDVMDASLPTGTESGARR